MCLVPGTTKQAVHEIGFGYKVFEMTPDGQLFSACYGSNIPREFGRWLGSNNYQLRIYSVPSERCDVGWHVYAEAADAVVMLNSRPSELDRVMVLREVEYRGAHSEGLGDGGWNLKARVIVAREIYIKPPTCPKCGEGVVVHTCHGDYCASPRCKWGWELELDGSPLKPPEGQQ